MITMNILYVARRLGGEPVDTTIMLPLLSLTLPCDVQILTQGQNAPMSISPTAHFSLLGKKTLIRPLTLQLR